MLRSNSFKKGKATQRAKTIAKKGKRSKSVLVQLRSRSAPISRPIGPGSMRQPRGMPGLNPNVNLGTVATNVPMTKRSQVIEEDEYIGEVSGSVAFATTGYNVNPGQSAVFPWGNKIASLYEEYEFSLLEFYYTAEVSGYATQGQTGTVVLSFNYDAADPPPTSKQQVEDTEPHTRPCLPSTPLILLKVDCANIKRNVAKFVRPGAQPANTDIKTYDCGILYVNTQGQTNTGNIGELHVRYKCHLREPVLESSGLGAPVGGQFVIQSAATGETSAATTVYGPLFASATLPTISSNGIGATIAASGLITLPAGKYLVAGNCLASDSAAAVTAQTGQFCQVTTANTQVICDTAYVGLVVTNQVSAHNAYAVSLPSYIHDTSQSGTTISMQVANTYASGTCLNQGYLSITYLGTVL